MRAEAEAIEALYLACCIEADNAEQFKGPAHIGEAQSQLQMAGMLRELSRGDADDSALEDTIRAHPLADWAFEWVADYVARNS